MWANLTPSSPKHLSYSWDHAKEMYDTAHAEGFGLMAGSSCVLAERRPPLGADLDRGGVDVTEAVAVHGGPMESLAMGSRVIFVCPCIFHS